MSAEADRQGLSRRTLLKRAASLGASSLIAEQVLPVASAAARRHRGRHPVPLPSPSRVRHEFTQMVRFGPRLTASEPHLDYVRWLEQEFTRAGLDLLPCDVYRTDRWTTSKASLELLAGDGRGEVKVSAYYPRSAHTSAHGLEGPLVYGGTAPALALSGTDLGALQAAIGRYPAELASWAAGLRGTLGGSDSASILLLDLPMPAPLTAAAFLPIVTYLNWQGHTLADWATADYKRTWIAPGLGFPLAPFQGLGAAGVAFIIDASYEALKGGYLPFGGGVEPIPALYVDRDTGRDLRRRAAGRPRARLTLAGTRKTVTVPAVTAVLPGRTRETLIFNTHTDGQGFAEENGGVAFAQLARYFASLPRTRRLKRTVVFACWPGHMTYDLPQTQGWIDAHPDLVKNAAAALTVEHLGCSEWIDTADRGYHATGQAETFGVWTTQGKIFELTRDTVIKHNIPRAALLRPPVQFGVGGAFQSAGVPQIGAIAGPEYLVTVSANGDLDKLDERLAARQIAWLADLASELDGVPAMTLRQGDPTLGQGGGGSAAGPFEREACAAPPAKPGNYRKRRHHHRRRRHTAG